MENGGSNTPTGTNEANSTLAFDPAVQSYYTPAYNNATTVYGSGNMYERPTTQPQNMGDNNFVSQTYGTIETPSVAQPTSNLHPNQLPISNSNPLLFTNYPTSIPAAPPPAYPPQHPNQMYSSSDQSRAGTLQLTSPHSLDQFLSSPQSHLLQLRGTNPPNQQPQANNFHMYGMPDRPQRFNTFHNLPYSPDPSLKQSAVGQIIDDDSSSGFSTSSSSHNRKKRKACGRCGPCQRKDNCGTCMNCVNRAKGKQICIYRKCEELKKKPGTESYSTSTTPDHQVEPVVVRQEKRKELEQLYSERKRSRTEDQSEAVSQVASLSQNFPGFTSTNQNFVQQPNLVASIPTQQQGFNSGSLPSHNNPVTLSFQQQLQQNHSPHNSYDQPLGAVGQGHTDIISAAFREIESNPPINAVTELTSVLNQGDNSAPTNKVSNNPTFDQQVNIQPWNPNLPSVESLPPQQQQPASLLQAQLEGTIRLPGQPPPLPPGPGPGQQPQQYQPNAQAGTQADQLLSNLTKFNEYGSFQRNVSSPNQATANKRSTPVRRPNYDNTPNQPQTQFSTAQTIGSTDINDQSQIAVGTPASQTVSNNSQNANMYHSSASLASYPMTSTVDPHGTNPLLSSQLHRPYDSPNTTHIQATPMQNYGGAMPQMASGMRYPNANFQHSPQYINQNMQMSMQRFSSNVPQQSVGSQRKVSLEQNPLFFQSSDTPAGTVPSNPGGMPNSTENANNYFQQQLPQKQWNNAVGPPPPVSIASNGDNPSTVKQEIISPIASHSALHSPVSSFNQEASDHGPTISHMPELAHSPVSQTSDGEQNKVKTETTESQATTPGNTGLPFVTTHSNASGTIGYAAYTIPQNGGSFSNNNTGSFLVQPGSGSIYNNYNQTQPQGGGSVPTASGPFITNTNGYTNHDQSMPAARLYESTTRHSENPFLPSTSNPNASGVWQRTQSDNSSTSIPSVTSQSDTNLTISPGESGYDSAEVVHGAEETAHRISQDQDAAATNRSIEMKKSMTEDVRSDGQSTSTINPNDIGPKNLYRAPVGNKTGSVIHNPAAYSVPFLETGLSSAGACATSMYKELNTQELIMAADTKNVHENTQNLTSKRSLSCDSAVTSEKSADNANEKVTVRLRRYSNQETSSIKIDCSQKIPKSLHSNFIAKTTMQGELEKERYNWHPSPRNIMHDQIQKQYVIPKPEIKLFNTYNKNQENSGQRRIVPFDTPPVTPRSVDFYNRHPSIDASTNENSINQKLNDILPTPPHTSDTPGNKFNPSEFSLNENYSAAKVMDHQTPQHENRAIDYLLPKTEISSQRGFKIQVDGSSPSKTQFAKCNCIAGTDGRMDEAPYYTHLGAAESVAGIRQLFEKRTGYVGAAIRIEKVIYTGKEGKTKSGCPMAKWIIRRSSEEEKILIVCRQRQGHHCKNAVLVVIILLWDGVARPLADFAYSNFAELIPKHGEPTERRCGTNDERTCGCQGFDDATCGASFSFGCSWSMYYNGCKYARSNQPNKYKLNGTKNPEAEKFIGMLFERLATVMSPLYQMAAPDAFQNQVEFEEEGSECRLGERTSKHSRPFSGVTTCFDFCAHSHKDQHNIDNGSTVVVTFTKPELRSVGRKPGDDEQLHVLPLCKLDISNEQGNFDGVAEKIKSGAIEILQRYRHESRIRKEPKLSKKQKMRAAKKKNQTTDSTDSPQIKRRGRPPKRCKSVENLYDGNINFINSPMREGLQSNEFQTPPRLQQHSSEQPIQQQQQQYPPFPNPRSPTRWPYRRQVAPPTYAAGTLFSPPTQNTPKPENVQPPPASSSNPLDNLPSIGNFFVPGQPGNPAENPPVANNEATNNCRKPSDENHPSTPLPSIKDVVTHPFHQNFAAVHTPVTKNSATGAQTPIQDNAPGTPHYGDTSINLKTYAAHNNAHLSQAIDTSTMLPASQHNFGNYGMQQTQMQQATSEQPFDVSYSDSEENFIDSEIGGVAVAPGHGSVLIECAKKELHATTALHRPNRYRPSRISMVFYHHKNMNMRNHGAAEYEAKEEERKKLREEKRSEEMQKLRENSNSNNFIPQQLLPGGMANPSISDLIPNGQFPVTGAGNNIWNPALATHPIINMPTSRPQNMGMIIQPHRPSHHHPQYPNVQPGRYDNLDQTRLKLRAQLIASSPHDRNANFEKTVEQPVRHGLNMQRSPHDMQFGNAMRSPQPAMLPLNNPMQNRERMMIPQSTQGWPQHFTHEGGTNNNNMKQLYMQHHMGLSGPQYPGNIQFQPQPMTHLNQYGGSNMVMTSNAHMMHTSTMDSNYLKYSSQVAQARPNMSSLSSQASTPLHMMHQMYNINGMPAVPNSHPPQYMRNMHSHSANLDFAHVSSGYPNPGLMQPNPHMNPSHGYTNSNRFPSNY
ncbi:uncharacterized protein LOC120347720 [Styela clava]